MIVLHEVRKTYEAEGRTVNALQGANLTIPSGEFVAIVGRSGCGKSTLLNILGGLDTPTSGRIEVGGRDVSQLNERELTHYRREIVGIVFQFFNLLPLLTAQENVALPALLANVAPRREVQSRARELLEAVGLGGKAESQASMLSGGEMQRVAVARSLINSPQVVLADEPTGNLDSRSAEPVLQALRDLTRQNGATVVMVTHSREAAAIADQTREMRDGVFVTE